jgi:hypothetical protein
MLFTNNLHQDALFAASIELVIEDVLPRAEVEFPIRDGDNNFPTHDLPLVVSVGVVFAGAVVVIPLGRWIERCQFFQPLFVVFVQAWFCIVNEYRRSNVHRVNQYKTVLHTAFADKSFHIAVDRKDGTPYWDFQPQFFGECFHLICSTVLQTDPKVYE